MPVSLVKRFKPRPKEPMPAILRELAQDAIERHGKRHAEPHVDTLCPEYVNQRHDWTCPYIAEDEPLWWALLLECFGTRSRVVGAAFLDQLASLCPLRRYVGQDEAQASEEVMRLALAMVYALKPRNEAEAAMTAQMVAVHLVTMRLGEHLTGRGYADPRSVASFTRLARTYAGQLETLHAIKGGKKPKKQVIRVEKHVHVHNERHVHLPPEVPVADAINGGALQALPGEGAEPLQIPRRREGLGRAER